MGRFISHITPKVQIFENFSGHGETLSIDKILASSTAKMDQLDDVSGDAKTYPLYQPSFDLKQIKSSAFGLKSKIL